MIKELSTGINVKMKMNFSLEVLAYMSSEGV